MGIGTGLSGTGITGAAGGVGGGLAGATPWGMIAEVGLGALGAAAQGKFQLKDDSTLDDAKAYAKQRAESIPLLGSLFSGLAQKVAEKKWGGVFENRDIKREQISDLQKSEGKMQTLMQQRMERLQDIPLLAGIRNSEIGNSWENKY